MSDPARLLDITGLKVHFPIRGGLLRRRTGTVRAVDGIDLHVGRGETLALVGESGCGKTTTGKTILRLIEPSAGAIRFAGTDIATLPHAKLAPYRRRMQIVFQDPYAALSPRRICRTVSLSAMSKSIFAATKQRETESRWIIERTSMRWE